MGTNTTSTSWLRARCLATTLLCRLSPWIVLARPLQIGRSVPVMGRRPAMKRRVGCRPQARLRPLFLYRPQLADQLQQIPVPSRQFRITRATTKPWRWNCHPPRLRCPYLRPRAFPPASLRTQPPRLTRSPHRRPVAIAVPILRLLCERVTEFVGYLDLDLLCSISLIPSSSHFGRPFPYHFMKTLQPARCVAGTRIDAGRAVCAAQLELQSISFANI